MWVQAKAAILATFNDFEFSGDYKKMQCYYILNLFCDKIILLMCLRPLLMVAPSIIKK